MVKENYQIAKIAQEDKCRFWGEQERALFHHRNRSKVAASTEQQLSLFRHLIFEFRQDNALQTIQEEAGYYKTQFQNLTSQTHADKNWVTE